jgi:ATP-dependent helicase/nuclease subunit A
LLTPALQSSLMPPVRFAAANQPECAGRTARLGMTPLSATLDDLPRWQALAGLLLTSTGKWRSRYTKNEGFPADKSGQAVQGGLE